MFKNTKIIRSKNKDEMLFATNDMIFIKGDKFICKLLMVGLLVNYIEQFNSSREELFNDLNKLYDDFENFAKEREK